MREISDARELRAVSHPLRLTLMEALVREGPLTATRAAELVGESPSNCSWHLRQLAKYGFVEAAEGGTGRNRPWRIASRGHRWSEVTADPEASAAAAELTRVWLQRRIAQLQSWLDERRTFPPAWQEADALAENLLYLTPEELTDFQQRFLALEDLYRDHTYDSAQRPEGALPVRILFFGIPLRPTESGG